MKTVGATCTFLFLSFLSFAQLPQTEIWVFDLQQTKAGYSISNPTKIAAGSGYNNQPYFTPDGNTMYFVSNGKKGGKTDIYKYDFKAKRKPIKQITKTKNEAEYSPMLTPNMERISCVRVAKDTVTQNLCTYNLKGKNPAILFPEYKTFGYYTWLSQIDLLSFHLPEPFALMHHNDAYKKYDTIYENIGRTIVNNKGQILYVDKSDSTNWQIKMLNKKRVNVKKYRSYDADKVVASTLEGEEDFAVLRGKDLLMGKGGFIYRKQNAFNDTTTQWEPFLDMNHHQLYNFYRIAVAPFANRIAVVTYTGKKP